MLLIVYLVIILSNLIVQFNEKISNSFRFLHLFAFRYRLFAPNPMVSDIAIYYRDLTKDNISTPLKEHIYFSKPEIKRMLWYGGNLKLIAVLVSLKNIHYYYSKKMPLEKILKTKAYIQLENEIKYIKYDKRIIKRQIVVYNIFDSEKYDLQIVPILISHIIYDNY